MENFDYRYQVKEEAREYHKTRKAFIIYNDALEFMPDGCAMSHFEWCQTKGIDKETFNKITRGFYKEGCAVFYKDNFIYDDALIEESLRYIDEIAEKLKLEKFEIYFGTLPPEKNWAYDYHYGKYENGKITKITKIESDIER